MLKTGIEHTIKHTVRPEDSARDIGSGLLDVFSTPAMIALMEKSAMMLVQNDLEEGQGTVGIAVNIKHLKASKIGVEVSAKATLTAVDDRRLSFALQVFEGDKLIGTGEHQRYIIDEAKFLAAL